MVLICGGLGCRYVYLVRVWHNAGFVHFVVFGRVGLALALRLSVVFWYFLHFGDFPVILDLLFWVVLLLSWCLSGFHASLGILIWFDLFVFLDWCFGFDFGFFCFGVFVVIWLLFLFAGLMVWSCRFSF